MLVNPTRSYSAKDLPANTRIKYREPMKPTDFKSEVEQKEAKDGGEGVVAVGDGNQQTTQHPPLPPSGRLFHLTTIFSTTMWIHVHGGDDGLRSFLVRACQWTANYLLVEPQPSGW